MRKSKASGSVMLAAYNPKGWRALTAGPHAQMRQKGSINYVVVRRLVKGRPGYCAEVMGTGKRRAAEGYRLRNEGEACGVTARSAIEKAVHVYFVRRSQKRRGSPIRNRF